MNSLIPYPDAIPVSWGWLNFFFILTFILHLVMMNITIGSSFFALAGTILPKNRALKAISADVTKKLPLLTALTINSGIPVLLFTQVMYGQFFYTSSILLARSWISIPLMLLCAYICAYLFKSVSEKNGYHAAGFIIIFAACSLAIAFIYSLNACLMTSHGDWESVFSRQTNAIAASGAGRTFSRYVHMLTAMAANGALFIALMFRFSKNNSPHKSREIQLALRCFILAIPFCFATGIWYLFSLDKVITRELLNSMPAVISLTCVIAAAVAASVAAKKMKVKTILLLTLFCLISMIFIRDFTRTLELSHVFSPEQMVVSPDYIPMYLFLLILAGGAAMISFLIKSSLFKRGLP